jgi:4a-hydroxytetrahydrobiopterin dehydratase
LGEKYVAELANRSCQACRPDSPAVPADQYAELLRGLPGWAIETIDGVVQLTKIYTRADFVAALELAQRIGVVAEAEDHHPRLVVQWGSLEISWWTHTIGGLHMNDFVLAARCEELAR